MDVPKQSIYEEAKKISRILNQAISEEQIVTFMRKIPLEKYSMRKYITLQHFFEHFDSNENLLGEIKRDALELFTFLPHLSYTDIFRKLQVLGRIPNRKEVFLREIVQSQLPESIPINQELGTKRVYNFANELESNDLKIKIRKTVNGFCTIPSKTETNTSPYEECPDPDTSSSSVTLKNDKDEDSSIEEIQNVNVPQILENPVSSNIFAADVLPEILPQSDTSEDTSIPEEPTENTNSSNVDQLTEYLWGSLPRSTNNNITKPATHCVTNSNTVDESTETNSTSNCMKISDNIWTVSNSPNRNFLGPVSNCTVTSNEIDKETKVEPMDTSISNQNIWTIPRGVTSEKKNIAETVTQCTTTSNTISEQNSNSCQIPLNPWTIPSSTNVTSACQNIPSTSKCTTASSTMVKQAVISPNHTTISNPPIGWHVQSSTNIPSAYKPTTNYTISNLIDFTKNKNATTPISSTTVNPRNSNSILAPPKMWKIQIPQSSANKSILSPPNFIYTSKNMHSNDTIACSSSTGTQEPPGNLENSTNVGLPVNNLPLSNTNQAVLSTTQSTDMPALQENEVISNVDNSTEFDLVDYIHEITQSPMSRIKSVLNQNNVQSNIRPPESILQIIINVLLSNDVEIVPSDDSQESTEEYYKDDLTVTSPEVVPVDISPDSSLDKTDMVQSKVKPAPVLITEKKKQMPEPPLIDLSSPGPSTSNTNSNEPADNKLVFRLLEMFPEACPDYVRNICRGKQWEGFDDIVTEILSAPDYPRRQARPSSPEREIDPEAQFEIIKEFLPDADPNFLRMQCDKFVNNPDGLKVFLDDALQNKNYPTMKEYLRKQQLSAQQKQYTTEFKVENFINIFPDPHTTFSDPNRNIKLCSLSKHYIKLFLRNKYNRIHIRSIEQTVENNKYNLKTCIEILDKLAKNGPVLKGKRQPVMLPDNLENIPLLQELAYHTHKNDIIKYLSVREIEEEIERTEAKIKGLVQTCSCCYDDEVMPKDIFTCENGCVFCRGCVKKSSEVAVGNGKIDFPCLADCQAQFSLQTLQMVLPPKLFSKVAQKKALAEVKAAGIEDLEMCPFCDFANIPDGANKIFRCLNPECMKESCRLCKEPSHIPLSCDEVEKDADVKARTYIEDKMTEALLRKCYKCGTKFFKEEGCNKMTCSCGAHMCYICGAPVKDYSHFNGIGGDKHHLCPLYSNTIKINEENVLKGAEEAKAVIDPKHLKVDPAADVKKHYKQREKVVPREPHMDLLNINQAIINPAHHPQRHNPHQNDHRHQQPHQHRVHQGHHQHHHHHHRHHPVNLVMAANRRLEHENRNRNPATAQILRHLDEVINTIVNRDDVA